MRPGVRVVIVRVRVAEAIRNTHRVVMFSRIWISSVDGVFGGGGQRRRAQHREFERALNYLEACIRDAKTCRVLAQTLIQFRLELR